MRISLSVCSIVVAPGALPRWLAALALAAASVGCGRNAVRATEKEFLADQIMSFDQDAHEAAADDHVLSNREGSTGGKGAQGGGCGCN